MAKVRVAFFLDVMEENFDGVAITMHQVIQRIPREEFEVIFITPQPPKGDIGFKVYVCPSIRLPEKDKEYLLALPWKMKELKSILDEFKPQVIHYSSPTFLGNFAVKYSRKNNIPVTGIYHTHYPSFTDYYFRFIPGASRLFVPIFYGLYKLYRRTNVVFAPTDPIRQYLLGINVKPENIKIWGRGVNTQRFSPKKRKEGLWKEIPSGNKIVLFVSRLVREKEPETLLRLYKVMEKSRSDLTMVLVGDGPTKSFLEESMPNAIFTGRLQGEDLAHAYASADVFVFPSTTETFGNVVLEAMASGLPVVAAAEGGPVDIVQEGLTGALVEPQNESAFFQAIVKILDDESYRLKLSQAATEYAKSQNWENLCAELFNEYRSLAK
ncbi:MAG: glycosyltransferase family 1 protein [Cyclobacteriaceae bacterium]